VSVGWAIIRPVLPQERFAALVDELVGEPGVTPPDGGGKGGGKFGSSALKVGGSIFAMLVGGELVVKLPAPRVAALVADGTGGPFASGAGRPMKEWVVVSPGADWSALAREALGFVGGSAAPNIRRSPGRGAR
jgi:hypothetical protein